MSFKEVDQFPSPWDGFSDKFIDYLRDKPPFFSRKSIPIFWPTGVYSFGKCLRSIYSWPSFLPLPIYCDHGSFVGLYLDFHERENIARHHLTWFKLKYQEKFNKRYLNKKLLHITSPQVEYRIKEKYIKRANSKGSIMFIPHTAGNSEYNTNKEEWMEYLNTWINNIIETINPEPPVVLCFHPTDLEKGYHLDLKKKFPLVTCGNGQNEDFIDRFYFIISHFNYAFGQSVGSDLFLCHELGLDYTLFGDQLEVLVTGEDFTDRSDLYFIQKEKYIREKFLFPKSYSLEDKNQRDEIINDHLGLGASKNKNKIRTIFVVDFLLLIPYSVGVNISFFIRKLKEFFLKRIISF